MSKRHVTARIDEEIMRKVDRLLAKYKGLGLSQILEIALASLMTLPVQDVDRILAHYLLQGFRKMPEEPTSLSVGKKKSSPKSSASRTSEG